MTLDAIVLDLDDTLLDTTGILLPPADAFSTPYPYLLPIWVTASARAVDIVNLRASFLEEIRENRREAFDFYVFIRNAYIQYRRKKVEDGVELDPQIEDDLYYFDDDDEFLE